MAVYHVNVGAREYHVEITADKVLLDGKEVDAHLLPLNNGGLYLLVQGAKQSEIHVDTYGCCQYAVMVGGRHLMASVDRTNGRSSKRKDAAHSGDLLAPMPSMIVAVRVAEGDAVEKGQVLGVLESMKMQMEFRAPFSGKVAQLAVQPGTHVEKGALLVKVVA